MTTPTPTPTPADVRLVALELLAVRAEFALADLAETEDFATPPAALVFRRAMLAQDLRDYSAAQDAAAAAFPFLRL